MPIGGTAVYVGLMSYLLVRSAGTSVAATVGFTLAFGGHFLALDHSLCAEFKEACLSRGRWLLALLTAFMSGSLSYGLILIPLG